ncbi:hypothetical protein BsWGS_28111 [Bradybaena similaris]
MNIRHCSTLTLLVLTLHICASQGQGSSCDIKSRPHPQGICGSRLSQAHSNLCFLLRQAYPQHFPSKRAANVGSSLDKLDTVPLPVLSELNFKASETRALLNRLDTSVNTFNNLVTIPRAITQISLANNENKLRRINDLTRALLNTEDNLLIRMKRVAAHSSMVCDCCFNSCSPRHLATYC